jgi:ubiquinone/menaquinone biosynthesis C-methylase UbiE
MCNLTQPISIEQHPRFTDRVIVRLWQFLAQLWYPVLTRLSLRHDPISFLNYGYASGEATSASLHLEDIDEIDRVCIQLYDHLTHGIALGGRKILEVSCGHGGGASYLARYLKPDSVHGIDRNPHAIRLCKQRHKVPGLTFSCGNAMSLKFARDSFDTVVNVEASHCYPDLSRFFREVGRVLRPGGYFLYADFRQTDPDHALLHRQVQASQLEYIRQENISSDVVRAMALNNDRYLQTIRRLVPRPLRKAAMSFAGLKGSGIYRALESGKSVYFFYVLRKPMAGIP